MTRSGGEADTAIERHDGESAAFTDRWALPALFALVAATLVCRAFAAFGAAFQQDEFQHWYTAWAMSRGLVPGRDFFLPGYGLIVDLLVPLFRIFPGSLLPLFISRGIALALFLFALFLVYRIGRCLGASPEACLLAVLSCVFYVEVIRRATDVRSDLINVVCVLAGVRALLSGAGWKPAALAGLALGVGLASSIKVAVAYPLLIGLGLFLYGWRWAARGAATIAAAGVTVLLYFAWIMARGLWQPFWEFQRWFFGFAAGSEGRISPWPVLSVSLRSNAVTIALWVVCLALVVWSGRAVGRRSAGVALFAASFAVVYVAANPAFYTYNFVDLVPVLSLVIPAAASGWAARGGIIPARTVVLLGVLLAVAGARPMLWSVPRSNELQLRYLEYIQAAVRPDETVFDLQGTHLFRRGPFHWHMTAKEVPRYRSGKWFSVADELRRARVSLIVRTYRLHWLPAEDWDFIRSHYVWAEPLLLFPGHLFHRDEGNRQRFEILLDGTYRFRGDPPDNARVDGAPAGRQVTLSVGMHELEFAGSKSPSFALIYTTPEREGRRLGTRVGDEIVPSVQ